MENQANKALLIIADFDGHDPELVENLPEIVGGFLKIIGITPKEISYASQAPEQAEDEGCCGDCEGCDTDEPIEVNGNDIFRALTVLVNNIVDGDMEWINDGTPLQMKYDPEQEEIGHPFFLFEGWKQKVAGGSTTLGYWEWVEESVRGYAEENL